MYCPIWDGKLHSLKAQQGRWLLINYWAAWCTPCLEEMPELQAFYAENKRVASVWGVTFEDSPVQQIRAFVKKLAVTYPILGRVGERETPFGRRVEALPTTLIIDPEGRLHSKIIGRVNGKILASIIESGG